MLRDAINQIRFHPGRVVATLIAIAISVGFMAGAVTFIATVRDSNAKLQSLSLSTSDVVAQGDFTDPNQSIEKVRSQEGVQAAEISYRAADVLETDQNAEYVDLYSVPGEAFRWSEVTEGRWPSKPDEVALAPDVVKGLDIAVGDQVKLGERNQRLTLVGITNDPNRTMSFTKTAYMSELPPTPGQNARLATYFLIKTDPDTDLDDLVNRLSSLLKPEAGSLSVKKGEAFRQEVIDSLTGEFDVLKYILLAFAGVSLLVGSIIITNTFNILVAQRRRQIGLLRAVGATGSQVRARFLAEASLLGILGSVLGLLLGFLAAAIGAWAVGALYWGLTFPVSELLLALLAGVVVTVVSAVLPSLRATRVSPMEALQIVPTEQRARRITLTRYIVCGLFGVLGAVLVFQALTATENNIFFALGAGFLLTIAVLGATPIYVPLLIKGLGKLFSFAGPTVRLATANAIRNPQRTASTATALMLAVGLIVTLQVAISTMRSTAQAAISNRYPVDVSVTQLLPDAAASGTGSFSDEVIAKAKTVPGLNRLEALKGGNVEVDSETKLFWSYAVAPGEAMGQIAPGARQQPPAEGQAYVSPETADESDVGKRVTVKGDKGSVELTLAISRFAEGPMMIVSEADLAKMTSTPEVKLLWLDLDDDAELVSSMRAIGELAIKYGLSSGGAAILSYVVNQVINVMLIVLSALLGVAVLIALVGVANTLSLSVLERKRESALLRALGMQKLGLRGMLLIEALLIAVVGALVGIGAGAFFGWLGTYSFYQMVPSTGDQPLVYSVDIWLTLGLLGIAIGAAALASILPGRKAANAAPTEALAEE